MNFFQRLRSWRSHDTLYISTFLKLNTNMDFELRKNEVESKKFCTLQFALDVIVLIFFLYLIAFFYDFLGKS